MPVQMQLARIIISELTENQLISLKEVDGEREFPILIGIFEATNIDRRVKEDYKPPRPLTHDLIVNVAESLDAEMHSVVISALKEHTYYAQLRLMKDGKLIVTGGWEGNATLWNRDGSKQLSLEHDCLYVYAVAISPDGSLIATGSDDSNGYVKIWEAATGELLWSVGEEKMTHATPTWATLHGVPQVLFYVQSGLVVERGHERRQRPQEGLVTVVVPPLRFAGHAHEVIGVQRDEPVGAQG